jgi:SoxA/TsdA, cytochrome c domain
MNRVNTFRLRAMFFEVVADNCHPKGKTMNDHQEKRQKLLKNLAKGLLYSTPLMVASIGISQIASAESVSIAAFPEASSEAEAKKEAMGEAEAEGAMHKAKGEGEAEGAMHKVKGEGEAEGAMHKAKGEGEAEGAMHKAKGEAEGEAKGEAEGEAKGEGEAEAEAEAEGNPKDIKRPMFSKRYKGDTANLAARGKELYGDTSLSTNGLSCNSCHTDMAGYNDTFKKAYPHYVAMGKDLYRQKKVTTESMVQICMQQPMEAKPLAWDSEELAALSAYVDVLQKEFAAK